MARIRLPRKNKSLAGGRLVGDLFDELPHHAVPLVVLVGSAVARVVNQADLVVEAVAPRALGGDSLQQVNAVALEAVVTEQLGLRRPPHHVRRLLWGGRGTNGRIGPT